LPGVQLKAVLKSIQGFMHNYIGNEFGPIGGLPGIGFGLNPELPVVILACSIRPSRSDAHTALQAATGSPVCPFAMLQIVVCKSSETNTKNMNKFFISLLLGVT